MFHGDHNTKRPAVFLCGAARWLHENLRKEGDRQVSPQCRSAGRTAWQGPALVYSIRVACRCADSCLLLLDLALRQTAKAMKKHGLKAVLEKKRKVAAAKDARARMAATAAEEAEAAVAAQADGAEPVSEPEPESEEPAAELELEPMAEAEAEAGSRDVAMDIFDNRFRRRKPRPTGEKGAHHGQHRCYVCCLVFCLIGAMVSGHPDNAPSLPHS